MYLHIIYTLARLTAGIFLALVFGGILGYLMATRKVINAAFNPLVFFFNPLPQAILLPIILVICGIGEISKIIIISLIIIFQVIVSVRDTILKIDNENIDYILSLGASKKQLINHVIIPEVIPGIISNIKISGRMALSILFFCEAFGTSWGMGHYVIASWSHTDYISMYKGIITVCIIGIILFLGIDSAENKVVKWKK